MHHVHASAKVASALIEEVLLQALEALCSVYGVFTCTAADARKAPSAFDQCFQLFSTKDLCYSWSYMVPF